MIKIQKIILAFCAVACVTLVYMFMHTRRGVSDTNILVVGTSPDYPPYESKNVVTGEIEGFDIDVINEVARRLGKKVVLKDKPFSALIFGLLSGEVDVIASGMSPSPRRAKFVSFTNTYIQQDPFVVVTLKNKFQPRSVQDLVGKTVVVNTGYTADAYLTQHEGINIIRLKSPSDGLIAIQSGSADAFVSAQSIVRLMLQKLSNKDDFAQTVISEQGDGCAFALRKDAHELTEHINAALDTMAEDGTLQKLKNTWNV